jgi:ferredoxin
MRIIPKMSQNEKSRRYSVFLKQQSEQFFIDSGQSILNAAMVANFRLPVSCRNGSCRTCMCKMLEGKVHCKVEWPSLSKEEKQDAWILPCIAFADSDLVLEFTYVEKVNNS